jgi:hypothetical protein
MITNMMPTPNDDLQQVRARIAATAARMIAQDGADYATAKAKAARQVLGVDRPSPNYFPTISRSKTRCGAISRCSAARPNPSACSICADALWKSWNS